MKNETKQLNRLVIVNIATKLLELDTVNALEWSFPKPIITEEDQRNALMELHQKLHINQFRGSITIRLQKGKAGLIEWSP